MDAFFASVEQAADPRLRGKALIVGSRGKKYRTVVAACSYEAKAHGVESGMSTVEAFRLCPKAYFISANSAKYLYTSDKIFRLLTEYTDRMEQASIDEFYLDLGCGTTADAARIARRIKDRITRECSITGSIGIAPVKIIAKMAAKARKPDGLLVLEGKNVAAFLRELPVEKIPGIGPRLKGHLNNLSIFTCGQLSETDPSLLTGRFGKTGLWMWQVSRGIDSDDVDYWDAPDEPPKSIGHSYTVEHMLTTRERLANWLRMLSEMVGYRLRKKGMDSCISCLWLNNDDVSLSREKKFYGPTQDSEVLFRRSLHILETFHLKTICVRAIGVTAAGLMPAQNLQLLSVDRKRMRLLGAVDRINERFGEWSVYPAAIQQIKN